jgi:putative ABC transport system permease protein
MRVLTLMLQQGMKPVVVGLGVGLVGAFAVTRIMRSLLFEVSATDAMTYVAVTVLLGVVGLVAAYVPSRRAAGLEPALTLRAD